MMVRIYSSTWTFLSLFFYRFSTSEMIFVCFGLTVYRSLLLIVLFFILLFSCGRAFSRFLLLNRLHTRSRSDSDSPQFLLTSTFLCCIAFRLIVRYASRPAGIGLALGSLGAVSALSLHECQSWCQLFGTHLEYSF